MTLQEKLEKLQSKLDLVEGQVNGLRVVLSAYALKAPDPQELLDALDRMAEATIAIATPLPISEQYLEGQRQAIDALKSILAARTRAR